MKDQSRLSTDLPRLLNDENTLEARVKHGRSRRVCAHTVSFPDVTPPGGHERGVSVMVTPSSVAHGKDSSSDTLCVLVSGSARWWLSMLIADSDMFPAASQAVIRLLVHFKKKKFMVSSDKRLDNRRSLDK